MKKLSTETKAGKALILIGTLLSLLVVIIELGDFSYVSYLVMAFIRLIGVILGFAAFKEAQEGNLYKAGIYGIIASLIPPLNIITIIGGILCLVSPESKRKKSKK